MEELIIGICDDLNEERTALAGMVRAHCRTLGVPARLKLFSSGEELLEAVQEPGRLHVLFLDIYMPGLSGMEAARQLRKRDEDVAIIFATTSLEHGVDSFEVQASDYLVKPFRQEEVGRALDWCMERRAETLRCLCVYAEWEERRIPLASIQYIEILDHRACIHCTGGKCLYTRRGLDDLEAAVDSADFLRCHRSYLVNLNHVQGMEGSSFRMVDGELVPIGSSSRARVRGRFWDWLYIKTRERR